MSDRIEPLNELYAFSYYATFIHPIQKEEPAGVFKILVRIIISTWIMVESVTH